MLAEEQQESPGQPPLSIIQITDTHLFESEAAKLVGLNCQDSFDAVLALIRRRAEAPDCILCTGDIAQDASVAAYHRFFRATAALGAPRYCIPGNHDVRENLHEALGDDRGVLRKAVVMGHWQILMLDSSVASAVHGFLADAELEFLERELRAGDSAGRHALVCLHHNPLPVNAEWLQHHALQNSEQFLAIIDRFPLVRGVLWGHIHQEFDKQRGGVRMMASPSTCVQFHPDNDEFTIDRLNPGYRWLRLHADGRVDSGVERVSDLSFDIDFSSHGY